MNHNNHSVGGRLLAYLALAIFPLFISSCIDVSEEIWVNNDGGGRLKFELGLSAEMAAMAKAGGEDKGPFDDADADLKDDPNVEKYEIGQEDRDGMSYYFLDVTVKDLSKLQDVMKKSMSDDDAPGGDMSIEKLENGNYKFSQPLDMKQGGAADDPAQAAMMAQMSAMFKDKFLTIKINGNIVSSNGEIASDNQSVEWKIPLADAMTGKVNLETAEAEVSPSAGGGGGGDKIFGMDKKLAIIIGAIGAVILLVIIIAVAKKK